MKTGRPAHFRKEYVRAIDSGKKKTLAIVDRRDVNDHVGVTNLAALVT